MACESRVSGVAEAGLLEQDLCSESDVALKAQQVASGIATDDLPVSLMLGTS